jgi:predicted AAA+ superfamily ATPase
MDEQQNSGLIWLTGSQQFHLMKNVSESLAGRAGILRLQGFSQAERLGRPRTQPFLPTQQWIERAGNDAGKIPLKELTAVSSELSFLQFIKAAAARMGQLVNYADMAADAGISQPTAKAWLSLLQTSGVVYLLRPW